MWISSAVTPLLWKNSIRIASCVLLFWSATVTGQENRSGPAASDAVEPEALKVVNESEWAHTVTPTLQDVPCTYRIRPFRASILKIRLRELMPGLLWPPDGS